MMKRHLCLFPLILAELFFINCRQPELKLGDLTVTAVDQFGNAIADASITLNDEQLKTDEIGKCVFKLNFSPAMHGKIKGEKEGAVFLGPEKISLLNPELRSVVLTFFRNHTLSITVSKNGEPFSDVTITIDGIDQGQITDGKFQKTIPGEATGTIKITVKARNTRKIKPPYSQTQSITLNASGFDHSISFVFEDMVIPPETPPTKIVIPPPPPVPAKLVITSRQSTPFVIEGRNTSMQPRQEIEIKPGQAPITVRSNTGIKVTINFNNTHIVYGRKYKTEVNFATRNHSAITDR